MVRQFFMTSHKKKPGPLLLRDPGGRPSYCFALPRGQFHVRQSRKTYAKLLSGIHRVVNAVTFGNNYPIGFAQVIEIVQISAC